LTNILVTAEAALSRHHSSCVAPVLSPVSIDRRTVSPTTRPTPASRMHGWPAVADLTSGRPIRIALFQVGAAPTAPAHCKLSQHISQQSDSFLCSLKPRGAPIAWLVFRTGLFCHRQSVAQPSTRATSIRVTSFMLTWITQVWHRTCGVMSSRLAQAFNVAQVVSKKTVFGTRLRPGFTNSESKHSAASSAIWAKPIVFRQGSS
jgi:hypothetical protein